MRPDMAKPRLRPDWTASPPGDRPPRYALATLAISLVVAVIYFPALQGDFVWDDVIFSEEPVIHSPGGLGSIWFSPADIRYEGHYWPLVYSSFWLEHKIWGLNPIGYHAVNILLHLANCLLLWRLLHRLAVPGALLIAGLFAVHPLHVESVAWIIERKDVLSGLFYLATALAWVRFNESPVPKRYALALALFTAGLLSKSVVVTLPVALLVWHWWQRGRITRADLLRLAPFAAVGVGVTLADLSFYTSREPLDLGYSLAERTLIAARALWFYAGKLVWPTDLAVIYPLWEIDVRDPLGWTYLAAAIALAALLWFGRGRIGRGPLAGALFFAVTLAPMLGFIDFGYMQFSFVADRFQYLAGIGPLAVLTGGAAYGMGKLSVAFRAAAGAAAVAVVLLFGALTWRQAAIYADEVTLFGHVVALNPGARDAHLNLANALIKAGRNEEGLAAGRLAAEQRPESADAYSKLGLALLNLGRFEESGEAFGRALELDPKHKFAMQGVAELLRTQGRYQEAVEAYRAVLDRDRRYALAHGGLGAALFELERYEEAIGSLSTSVTIHPGAPFGSGRHLLMGQAARALGQLDRAEEHLRQAVSIEPGLAPAILDLAGVLRAQGRHDEAAALISRARELRPNDPAYLQNFAERLRTEKRYDDALDTFREVLAISPDFALAYAGMGDTLFRMERYDESLEAMNRALSLQPDIDMAGSLHGLAGQAAHHLNRPDEAARHYGAAIRRDPLDTESIDRLAMLRFGEQRYEAALALYQDLIELTPDSAQTYFNLGATLYYLDRHEEALHHFARAVEIDPGLQTAQAGLEALRARVSER